MSLFMFGGPVRENIFSQKKFKKTDFSSKIRVSILDLEYWILEIWTKFCFSIGIVKERIEVKKRIHLTLEVKHFIVQENTRK